METNDNLNPEPENGVTGPSPITCINCSSTDILDGYPNALCANCRANLINFPIPMWVKLFGAGVAAVMLIALIWLPGNLKAAIAYERAERAEKNLDYATAQKELEKAREFAPNSIDILSHLLIAGYHNDDFTAVSLSFTALKDKKITDSVLYNRLISIINLSAEYFPTDTFNLAFKNYKNEVPDTAYIHYLKKHSGDIYATYALASTYAGQLKYVLCDSVLSRSLIIDPDFHLSLNLKTMVKRELNQLDSSLYYADRMLSQNHQSRYALSSKARTLLKKGQNQPGLKLALQCYDIDKAMPYNIATLALAYHLNKNYKQRDAMVHMADKDTVIAGYMTFAKDVINNKIKFQN